jgi:BirA family biotin operon repressor/biotin-[acetyl-CoA-carboxylase] ligase
LVVGENKLAGILAEVVGTERDLAVVVGLGVNLTYPGPEGVESTSVLLESGLTIAPRALLDLVLEELETRRAQLGNEDGQQSLRKEYESALATIGQTVRVEQLGGTVVGRAHGVDTAGQLLVEVEGVVQTFGVGDVVHVRHGQVESA